MPTFPSPSYHGYDVTDYRGVNADYGSLADMRALVAAAHKRGIAVILDLPLNHTSSKNPWFVASEKSQAPYADWYVWANAPQGSNWQSDGKRYYYAGFGAFLTNHDQDRVASQLGGDPTELRVAADLLLTGPGVPFIYYGEEIGMTGRKPDERIRTPMRWDASSPGAGFSTHDPWEAISDDPPSINVAAEAADPQSLLSHYRDLIQLRAAHPALADGVLIPVASDLPGVVAALRESPTETALVLTNVSAAAAAPTLSLAAGHLCGSPAAELALGSGSAVAPHVTPSGGFAGYRPLISLPSRSTAVIVLGH
jgi:glycosidase